MRQRHGGGVATIVPLPGGIGGVEFAVAGMVIALTAIDPAVVGAMVVLYRLCVCWFIVVIGAGCLTATATSIRSFADAADRPETTESVEPTRQGSHGPGWCAVACGTGDQATGPIRSTGMTE